MKNRLVLYWCHFVMYWLNEVDINGIFFQSEDFVGFLVLLKDNPFLFRRL